jgi:hypothetical protein
MGEQVERDDLTYVRKSTFEFFTQLVAMLPRRLVNREGKVEVVVVMGRKDTNLEKLIRFFTSSSWWGSVPCKAYQLRLGRYELDCLVTK